MTLTQNKLDCPVCRSHFSLEASEILSYPSGDKTQKKQALKFQSIYFCPSCEVGIAFPMMRDEDIEKIYEGGEYWQNFKVKRFVPRRNPVQYLLACVRWQFVFEGAGFAHSQERLSILDIGGGHGYFGVAAARHSPGLKKFCVVEKDKFFRESLKLTWLDFYKDVEFKAVESMGEVEGLFDVIVLSHILEHLNDPGGMVASASRYLAPGGVLLIDVPHQDYLFKPDVFPHVLFYNSKSMTALCTRLDLKVIRMQICGRSYDWMRDKGFIRRSIEEIQKGVYKIRKILPLFILQAFFAWFFQPAHQNPQGMWLRCLVKRI